MEVDSVLNKSRVEDNPQKVNPFKPGVQRIKKKKHIQLRSKLSEKSKAIQKGEGYKERLAEKLNKRNKRNKNK